MGLDKWDKKGIPVVPVLRLMMGANRLHTPIKMPVAPPQGAPVTASISVL